MKNKKLIRLTESDLHRIVKESVNKVLNEMDYDGYERAMRQHHNLMNRVDPRTFANRARGINAQGRLRNDDTDAMYDGAVKAWNDRFGHQEEPSHRSKVVSMIDSHPSDKYDYSIFDFDHSFDNDYNVETYDDHFYYPKDDSVERAKGEFEDNKRDIFDPKWEPSNEKERPHGYDIARQMANGTGKYDPNKGWQ